MLSEVLDRQAPQVQAWLREFGECREQRPSVWIVDTFGHKGMQFERCVVLRADAMRFPEFFLTHELVHWYAVGTPWSRLPKVVEEGLADHAVCQLLPEYEGDRRNRHSLVYSAFRQGSIEIDLLALLREDWEDWEDFNESDYAVLYAVGFAIVERIGIDALHQLCLDHGGGVPPEVLLDRARLSPQGSGF